jgi:ferritin-like metal-binding protein YciE
MELQQIHSAENQLSRMIPRLTRAASSAKLQELIEERMHEGEKIIQEVESALEELGKSPGRSKNIAAEGLINDLREHVYEIESGPALDAVLIAGLQKTEHYCIAAWGTSRALAKAVGQKEAVRSMERALKEGGAYDERLTRVAEQEVTPELAEASDEDSDEQPQQGRRGAEDRRSAH